MHDHGTRRMGHPQGQGAESRSGARCRLNRVEQADRDERKRGACPRMGARRITKEFLPTRPSAGTKRGTVACFIHQRTRITHARAIGLAVAKGTRHFRSCLFLLTHPRAHTDSAAKRAHQSLAEGQPHHPGMNAHTSVHIHVASVHVCVQPVHISYCA